jgi:hypothetical protein
VRENVVSYGLDDPVARTIHVDVAIVDAKTVRVAERSLTLMVVGSANIGVVPGVIRPDGDGDFLGHDLPTQLMQGGDSQERELLTDCGGEDGARHQTILIGLAVIPSGVKLFAFG